MFGFVQHPSAVSRSSAPATPPTPLSSCRKPLGGLQTNVPPGSSFGNHKATESAVTSAASSTKAAPAPVTRGIGRLFLMKVRATGAVEL